MTTTTSNEHRNLFAKRSSAAATSTGLLQALLQQDDSRRALLSGEKLTTTTKSWAPSSTNTNVSAEGEKAGGLQVATRFGKTVMNHREYSSSRRYTTSTSSDVIVEGEELQLLDLWAGHKLQTGGSDGSSTTVTSVMTDNLSASSLGFLWEDAVSEEPEFVQKSRSMKENRAARTIQGFFQNVMSTVRSGKQKVALLNARLQTIQQRKQEELMELKTWMDIEKETFRLKMQQQMNARDQALDTTRDNNLHLVHDYKTQVLMQRQERNHLRQQIEEQEQTNQQLEMETEAILSKCHKMESGFQLVSQRVGPWRRLEKHIKCKIPRVRTELEAVNQKGTKCKSQCSQIHQCILNIINLTQEQVYDGHVEAGQSDALGRIEESYRTCKSTALALVGIDWLAELATIQPDGRPISCVSQKINPSANSRPSLSCKPVSHRQLDIDADEWQDIKMNIKRRKSRRSTLKKKVAVSS